MIFGYSNEHDLEPEIIQQENSDDRLQSDEM